MSPAQVGCDDRGDLLIPVVSNPFIFSSTILPTGWLRLLMSRKLSLDRIL